MSSSRLPGKVLLPIEKKPMLYYVIKQTKASKLVNDMIIATTTSDEDDVIVDFCEKYNLKYFRGSKSDVLDRYYKCAKKFGCDPVVRISSDCPLIDPTVIDKVIKKFLNDSYDYIGTSLIKSGSQWKYSSCNFPQGMAVEISTFKALEKTWKEAKKPSEREHVFTYIPSNPKLFRISNVKNRTDLSYIRCTVDRKEDLHFVQKIYEKISKKKPFVRITDILEIVQREPSLLSVNKQIPFDEGYKRSQLEDAKRGFK